MDKRPDEQRHEEDAAADREDAIRHALDEQGGDDDTSAMAGRRTGEDPGLLELTEDPRERRLKRHTM